MDMDKDLSNCKAVLVDVSASRILVEAFIEEYVPGQCPLVLVTSECGSSDRRKELAQRVIEENGPTVISGRLADIYSVSQDILEKGKSPLGSLTPAGYTHSKCIWLVISRLGS